MFNYLNEIIGSCGVLPFRQIYIVIGQYTADIEAYLKYKNMQPSWRERDHEYSCYARYWNNYNLIYYYYYNNTDCFTPLKI